MGTTLTEIVVGSRVCTEAWPDLRRQTGVVQQIEKVWVQVLWKQGASWIALKDVRLVGEAGG